jgi:dihydrofolate reductase
VRGPDWMEEWEVPFAEAIDRTKKHVVSSTLSGVDWNAELVQGDLGPAIEQLKAQPGEALSVGGVTLPLALADLGLIDEYEFLVQPVLAGHGPTLLAGLRDRIPLELVHRREFRSGGGRPALPTRGPLTDRTVAIADLRAPDERTDRSLPRGWGHRLPRMADPLVVLVHGAWGRAGTVGIPGRRTGRCRHPQRHRRSADHGIGNRHAGRRCRSRAGRRR